MPLFDNPRPFGARAIAFVFQGGGSLSAPQVGMLWALTEAGVAPDLVVGSSAGALNAVAFASDPSPGGLDHLEAAWVSLRRRRVAPFSLRALLAALAGRGDAFVSDTALQVLLERAALARTLRERAFRLTSWRPTWPRGRLLSFRTATRSARYWPPPHSPVCIDP